MSRDSGSILPGACRLFTALLLVVGACGCATHRQAPAWQVMPLAAHDAHLFAQAERTLHETYPPQYRATHRAIITVRQRQFVCDGFLSVSPLEGWHLALVSLLGLITEVRVKGDGSHEVLQVTSLFRESWSREYVALELHALFAPPPTLRPVGRLADGRLVLEGTHGTNHYQARYLCRADGCRWEELELLAGTRRLCHARLGGYRPFVGWAPEVPTDIELDAGAHKLHLRLVALSLSSAPTSTLSR